MKSTPDNLFPQQRSATPCVCGSPMKEMAGNLYRCTACGRMRWGDERLSGAVIALIAALVIVAIIVLGYIGVEGEKYR